MKDGITAALALTSTRSTRGRRAGEVHLRAPVAEKADEPLSDGHPSRMLDSDFHRELDSCGVMYLEVPSRTCPAKGS